MKPQGKYSSVLETVTVSQMTSTMSIIRIHCLDASTDSALVRFFLPSSTHETLSSSMLSLLSCGCWKTPALRCHVPLQVLILMPALDDNVTMMEKARPA
jgi:hypothetical protein